MADGRSVFGSIKSKLGLDNRNPQPAYEAYQEYDEYDEYDDYGDGYEDDYRDDYAMDSYDEYGNYGNFGNRGRVTSRAVGGGLPRLVSREDARESTRGSMSFSSTSSRSSRGTRTMVDSSLPASLTPEGAAAVTAATNRRAEGLDSLFGSTARTENRSLAFDAKASATAAIPAVGKRNLQVIKPTKYDDAEGVTRALKLGNVAILVLTGTTEVLSRRVLDFAFGATSALDGEVEGIAPKTYALTTKAGLTESEKAELANLGVI